MPTKIEWAGETWNPIRGCTKVSAGCQNCYAERMARRFSGPGGPYATVISNGRWNGSVAWVPDKLDQPLHWKKPRRAFVNSMGDLFHEAVTDEQIARVWGVMARANWHTFLVLTKRPRRMHEWLGKTAREHRCHPHPLPNVWLGVTAENQEQAEKRIPLLLDTPAAVRFVSCEPLLGTVDLSGYLLADYFAAGTPPNFCPRDGMLDWVIIGGESGPGARPCETGWVREIVCRCKEAGVPVFVKQLGGHPDKRANPDEWGPALRVRQWPEVRT
jgi:protein gp37